MNTPFNQWLEANRAALAPVTAWQELAVDTANKLAQHNLAVARDCVDFGARQLNLLGEAKDPQKWATEETKAAAEFGQTLVDRGGDFFKLAKETQDAVGAWADQAAKTALNPFAAKVA